MGSECNSNNKPHYDIAMSKRTRKPLISLQEANEQFFNGKGDGHEEEEPESERKSLKQFFNGGGTGTKSSTSLSHHFTEEEKQLPLVKKHNDHNNNGVKLKGLVSRYAKVLSHMVKVKREPSIGSRKKHQLPRLKI